MMENTKLEKKEIYEVDNKKYIVMPAESFISLEDEITLQLCNKRTTRK